MTALLVGEAYYEALRYAYLLSRVDAMALLAAIAVTIGVVGAVLGVRRRDASAAADQPPIVVRRRTCP
jgi:hypothetical protein